MFVRVPIFLAKRKEMRHDFRLLHSVAIEVIFFIFVVFMADLEVGERKVAMQYCMKYLPSSICIIALQKKWTCSSRISLQSRKQIPAHEMQILAHDAENQFLLFIV